MAASANPAGNGNDDAGANGTAAAANGCAAPNGKSAAVGPTQAAIRHSPVINWTPEEQALLEELLTKYASETNVVRYAKIAMMLKDKTVRDVALRCRWMHKKENGKRRKDDHNSARKNKEKKEKASDPMAKATSQNANRSNGPPYAHSVMPVDVDDGISFKAIGGVAGQLLEQNAQALDQISANFAAFKIHENLNLFHQARSNILTILNDMNDIPEIMKQMPPLPVKLHDELANNVLGQPSFQKTS